MLTVERFELSAWPQVSPIWADLAADSPYTTFFISLPWVEAWLEVFGANLPVEILLFREPDRVAGACLLVRRTLHRGPIPVRCLFLNTAGVDEADDPYLEFNNLLCRAGTEQAVATALRSYLQTRPWDQVVIHGFCQGPPLEALMQVFSGTPSERIVRANFLVDLKRLRESGTPYENVLGAKDRARLRQNFRSYGEITVSVPTDLAGAMEMLGELAGLHSKSWQDRNKTGAFASASFRAFHESLIRRALGQGGIQLARVSGASGPIGVLYNMVHRGRVYFYQSGLVYSTNKRVRPGFVSLARTIHYCVERPDLDEFHFMPNSDHYKEPMSTNRQELEWIVFQKPNLTNAVIRSLRALKRRWSRLRANAGASQPGEENES